MSHLPWPESLLHVEHCSTWHISEAYPCLFREQISPPAFECVFNTGNCAEKDVQFTSFNSLHSPDVEFGELSKVLLRES